jgi:hypothetical protein
VAEVLVYTFSNNKHSWTVDTVPQAREYAKRIITEGLWISEGPDIEVFYPPHQIFKVKVLKSEEEGS